MSITLRFDFTGHPGPATTAIAEAAALIRQAQASPLGCCVEVVRNGLGDGIAEALAEQIGGVLKVDAAVAIANLPEAEQERAIALAGCINALEEMAFTAGDLRFILVFLTMCWGTQPAALFAQLQATAGEAPV